MNNIIIDDQKEFDALKDEHSNVSVSASLILNCNIKTTGSIEAGGYIEAGEYIKAGGSIEAGVYIEAGGHIEAKGYIEAGGSIKAEGSIEAGVYIEAGWLIEAGGSIKAGGSIEAGEWILSGFFHISCEQLKTKTLPFNRYYYSKMPYMAKWKEKIEDDSLCWNELRDAFREDAAEIIDQPWHPIIKAQIEMFLDIKDEVAGKQL